MKKLDEKLSFTRNNLYQYIKSKNKVILLIIQQDFIDWANNLHNSLQTLNPASLDNFYKYPSMVPLAWRIDRKGRYA